MYPHPSTHELVLTLQIKTLWITANLIGESLEVRNEYLGKDITKKVTKILCKDNHDKAKIKTGVWLLSNLARGKPYPPLDKASSSLPLELLTYSIDGWLSEYPRPVDTLSRREDNRERTMVSLLYVRFRGAEQDLCRGWGGSSSEGYKDIEEHKQ